MFKASKMYNQPLIPVIAIPSIIYFCADKYTSTTGNITILHAAISTGQSVKYNL